MRIIRAVTILVVLVTAVTASQAVPFTSFYGEAFYSGKFGASAFGKYTAGERSGNSDSYGFVSLNSTAKNVQLSSIKDGNNGVRVGAGVRQWVMNRQVFAVAEFSKNLYGNQSGETEFQVGGVGSWSKVIDTTFQETYGELIYTESTRITSLNVVHRIGKSGKLDGDPGTFGAYTVGLLSLNAGGSNGNKNSNRAEVGVGARYSCGAHFSAVCEMRVGAYLGDKPVNESTGYVNPVIGIMGSY